MIVHTYLKRIYKEIAIKWCKERNLRYYYEAIYVDDINQSMYDLIDKINSNKERSKYYSEKLKKD